MNHWNLSDELMLTIETLSDSNLYSVSGNPKRLHLKLNSSRETLPRFQYSGNEFFFVSQVSLRQDSITSDDMLMLSNLTVSFVLRGNQQRRHIVTRSHFFFRTGSPAQNTAWSSDQVTLSVGFLLVWILCRKMSP